MIKKEKEKKKTLFDYQHLFKRLFMFLPAAAAPAAAHLDDHSVTT